LLIQSVAQLKDQFPQLRLLIVGSGERQTELQHLAQQFNIANHVTFTGYRSDAQRLMQGMDLFALPSEVEGQPVSIMEAMQHALPVIATTVGGIPDIAIHQQTALLSPPGNLDAFTQNLTTLLQNEPLRKTLGQKGQQRIQQEFSVQNMTQRFTDCYRACLR
jgi:glycosyltransferase involved in cell wall biosynthesis